MFKTLFFCPWCDLCQSVNTKQKKKLHHSFTFLPQPSSHLSSVQCRTKCRIHPLSLSETAPPSHSLSWPVRLFSPNSTSASLCVCVLIVSLCAWVLPTVFFSGLLELWQVCSCKESVRCASFPKTTQPTSPPTSPPSPASPSSLRHQCGHHHRNPKKSWSTYNDLTLCVQLDHD